MLSGAGRMKLEESLDGVLYLLLYVVFIDSWICG